MLDIYTASGMDSDPSGMEDEELSGAGNMHDKNVLSNNPGTELFASGDGDIYIVDPDLNTKFVTDENSWTTQGVVMDITNHTTLEPIVDMSVKSLEAMQLEAANHPMVMEAMSALQILLPIICLLGIIGNILNIVVLSKKRMKSSTSSFLIGLAVSDLMLMVIQVPWFIGQVAGVDSPSYTIFSRYYIIARYVLSNIFITCTSWMTVAVAFERLIAMCFPLRCHLFCSMTRARVAICLVFAFAILAHLSKAFEFVPVLDVTSDKNTELTDLIRNPIYEYVMHWVNIMLAVVVPFFILLILNILIIFLVVKRKRKQKHLAQHQRNKYVMDVDRDMLQITVAVVAVITVFLICHSLGVFLAANIIYRGSRGAVYSSPAMFVVKNLNNFLVVFNSSINFILYCAISSNFQQTFVDTLCCLCRQSPMKAPLVVRKPIYRPVKKVRNNHTMSTYKNDLSVDYNDGQTNTKLRRDSNSQLHNGRTNLMAHPSYQSLLVEKEAPPLYDDIVESPTYEGVNYSSSEDELDRPAHCYSTDVPTVLSTFSRTLPRQ